MFKFKSAKSTLIGFSIGILCVVSSIMMSGNFRSFLNWPSVFITVGGTLGAMIVAFPPNRLKTLGAVMKKSFSKQTLDLDKDIQTIVTLSNTIRKDGALKLEDSVDRYTKDEFLKKGLMLLVDGADREFLKCTMQREIYRTAKRHQKGQQMIEMIAATAPSLGLLGTYIGLIPMLEHLEDPTKLGPLMAIELVTSFYGAFIAYVVFSPMAKRLRSMSSDEMTRKELLLEGLLAIEAKQNPRMIIETLTAYLTKQEARSMRRKQQAIPGIDTQKKVLTYNTKRGQ